MPLEITSLVQRSRVVEVSAKDGSIKRTLAEVPKEHTHGDHTSESGFRFNDGKCTPGGTYILGRMHYEGPAGGPAGRLYTCALLIEQLLDAAQCMHRRQSLLQLLH